jgi:MFS family permease
LISTRTGTRPLLVIGMALQAVALGWISLVITPTVGYARLVPSFVIAGTGMGLFFAPIANVVLSAVRPEEEGVASGATNAIRELGGVFGVAVLAAVFTAYGSYASPTGYVDGLIPAMQVGAVAVGLAALAALVLPGRARVEATEPAVEHGLSEAPMATA